MGFVFQFQVALLKLLPYALEYEEAAVSLEVLDDVELTHRPGKPPEFTQVHQSGNDRKLTDHSPKVWRTLAIWGDHLKTKDPSEVLEFTLLTTQTAAPGSGVAALTASNRQVDDALARLNAVAEQVPGSSSTAADRAAFLQLSDAQQRRLLSSVTILDQATPPIDMRAALVEGLMATNDARFIGSMADSIEGWWWGRIPSALETGSPIFAIELRTAIDEARRMHSEHALPVFDLDFFGDEDLPEGDLETARFMQCLVAIEARPLRKREASTDYRLAVAHRSRWARKGLLGTNEISRYEKGLSSTWLISSERMVRSIKSPDDASAMAAAGHDLWDEMEQNNLPPIRRDTSDSFIQKGSFHILAEEARVAWHPDTVRRIHDGLGRQTS
jgi:hypothetical protein